MPHDTPSRQRIRNSMALLQQNSEGCALNHYGDDAGIHGMPGWLADTRTDLEAFTDILAALAVPINNIGEDAKGTFACSICGDDKPHHHMPAVVDTYQNKRSRS